MTIPIGSGTALASLQAHHVGPISMVGTLEIIIAKVSCVPLKGPRVRFQWWRLESRTIKAYIAKVIQVVQHRNTIQAGLLHEERGILHVHDVWRVHAEKLPTGHDDTWLMALRVELQHGDVLSPQFGLPEIIQCAGVDRDALLVELALVDPWRRLADGVLLRVLAVHPELHLTTRACDSQLVEINGMALRLHVLHPLAKSGLLIWAWLHGPNMLSVAEEVFPLLPIVRPNLEHGGVSERLKHSALALAIIARVAQEWADPQSMMRAVGGMESLDAGGDGDGWLPICTQ